LYRSGLVFNYTYGRSNARKEIEEKLMEKLQREKEELRQREEAMRKNREADR
jgi:hypothetical protein